MLASGHFSGHDITQVNHVVPIQYARSNRAGKIAGLMMHGTLFPVRNHPGRTTYYLVIDLTSRR